MEKAGTGIRRVIDACEANKNTLEFDFTDAFWITLNSNKTEDNVGDNVGGNVVDKRLMKVVEIIKANNSISAKEIASLIGVTSRTIERDVEKLKASNKIKREGDERSGYWKVIE